MNYLMIFIILCAAITSWVLLVRLVQTLLLFIFRRKPHEFTLVEDEKLPKVTVLIPAYNEEKVIGKSLRTISQSEYPDDKFEVLVINPGSKDQTSAIAWKIAKESQRNIKVIDAKNDFEHHGKPRALNFALKYATGEIIIVYDADSLVDKKAVKHLTSYLTTHPNIAMVFGMRKAMNPHSFFTRLVYLESLSQQLLTEAAPPKEGQKFLFSPGTNVAIRKSVLEEIGGWDDNALTEDFEISTRLHYLGHRIEYIPPAISHEEVVENCKIWIKQRTRWNRGGNHVIFKVLKNIGETLKQKDIKLISFILLYKLIEFYSPLFGLLISDILFVLGALEIFLFGGMGIGFFLWLLLYTLFFLQNLACLFYVREVNLNNIISALFFPFYLQLWLLVFIRAVFLDFSRRPILWEKTERFTA